MRFELTDRDRHVVQSVSMLTQVSSFHIRSLLFSDVHRISMDRSLKRLRDQKLIRKVGVRAVAYKGGTAPAVYSLGPRGWFYMARSGNYPGVNSVQEHTLNIADLYVALVEQEREGAIKLLPDTSLEFGIEGARADLYVDVALPAIAKRRRFLVEVQRNARKDVIRQKIEAHWQAFQTSTEPNWPRVAFVVWDEYLAHEIKRQIPADKKTLFDVYMSDEFLTAVTSVGSVERFPNFGGDSSSVRNSEAV